MSSARKLIVHQPIASVGEALVDLMAPPASRWEDIDRFTPRIGGAPANASVAISRLGGRAAILGRHADDDPGRWIRHRLAAEGVDLSWFSVSEHAQTRIALVTGPDSQRTFSFYGEPAADTQLTPEDVERAGLEDVGAVILSSLLLTAEPSRSAMLAVLAICGAADVPVIFDPNPRPQIWPDREAAYAEIIPFIRVASILKLGESEPASLGMSVDEIRSEQPTGSVLVVTDGARGLRYWYGGNGSTGVPAPSVESVDSTGAGDAFTAALALKYTERGRRLEHEDFVFAAAVGALTTTATGAMDALPDRNQVEEFLAAQKANEQQ